MIKQLLIDIFGPSIIEIRKFKYQFAVLKKENALIKRMNKILMARHIMIDEAEINEIYGNKLARNAFIEADRQIDLAYKYLENQLKEEKNKLYN